MITKELPSLQGHIFCPNCHKEIKNNFNFGNIKIPGSIKLICGNCKKGQVIIKGSKL